MEAFPATSEANTKHQLCHAERMMSKRNAVFARECTKVRHRIRALFILTSRPRFTRRAVGSHRPHSGVATNIGGKRQSCASHYKYPNRDQDPFEVLHSISFCSSAIFFRRVSSMKAVASALPQQRPSDEEGWDQIHATAVACADSRNCQLAAWMLKFLEGDARPASLARASGIGLAF